MKPLFYLVLFCVCCSFSGKSQKDVTVRITSQRFDKVVTFTSPSLFLDSTFQSGMVSYKSGEVGKALMNYNLAENEIYFVKGRDEVLKLVELEKIKCIKYGGRTFIYSPKYNLLELVKSYSDNLDLFIYRQSTIKVQQDNDGAYGTNTTTAAITRNSSFEYSRGNYKFSKNEPVEVEMKSTYLVKFKGKFKKVRDVNDLVELFPNKKQVIEDFVKANSNDKKMDLDINLALECCMK